MRLTGFLDRLLEANPGNIKLWIDRPDEIAEGSSFKPACKLVEGIDIGDEWNDSIEDALKRVDAVLVFWSKEAKFKDSSVFADEIYYARKMGKLVAVSFDSLEEQPFIYSSIQVADLSKDPVGKFQAALNKIDKLFKFGPLIADVEPSFELNRLPYLANRDRNAGQINRQIMHQHRLGHYVVPCVSADAFDKFAWRIAEVDGPQLWKADGGDTLETWSRSLVEIDPTAELEFFAEDLDILFDRKSIDIAFQENITANRPMIIYGELRADRIEAGEHLEWIGIWIKAVESCVAKYDIKYSTNSEIHTPICAVLAVLSEPALDEIYKDLPTDLSGKLSRPRRLQDITSLHFEGWLSHEEVKNYGQSDILNLGRLEQHMSESFAKDDADYSMREFYELVRNTPAWQEFLEASDRH